MSEPFPQYSVAQARDQLAQLIRQAEHGTPVEITRRGKPVAVLLSAEEFERLSRHGGTFGKSLAEFRRRWGIDTLALDPDEVFEDVRDRSPGREVVL